MTNSCPANDNADPFATVRSSLDWLYLLRRDLLSVDVATMPFEQRRLREKALKRFERAEALLLAEL